MHEEPTIRADTPRRRVALALVLAGALGVLVAGAWAATVPGGAGAETCPACLEAAGPSVAPEGAPGRAGLLDTEGFPPRWRCGTWPAALGWLHIGSDLVIWAAYVAIPCVLFSFIRARSDLPFPVVFWLFIAFILACGTTHLVEAILFWVPVYRLAGFVKLATALVSLAAVGVLVPVVPRALSLRSPENLRADVDARTSELRRSNEALGAVIRQRREAEAALADSEARFRSAFLDSPVGILLIDEGGTVRKANREAERLLGYSEHELEGMAVESFVPEALRSGHGEHRRRYLEQPENRRMGAGRDLSAVRKDGSEVPVEVGLSPIRLRDGLFVLSSIVDVTLRKEAEKVLRDTNAALERRIRERTAELERSNADLEHFAHVASHDLQEPLRMVANYTELLAEEHGDALQGDAKEYLRFATEGARRMQQLLADLLSYSRVQSSKARFVRTRPDEILDTVVLNLELAISEAGASITRSELPDVRADPAQLLQVFQNLIANALRFRGERPFVVQVSGERNDGTCTFSVRDNGIGVEPKHAERIFQIFKRVHARERYSGSGVGLAICKRIVEHHGGRIWVEPNEDGGATFRFTLRSAEGTAAAA